MALIGKDETNNLVWFSSVAEGLLLLISIIALLAAGIGTVYAYNSFRASITPLVSVQGPNNLEMATSSAHFVLTNKSQVGIKNVQMRYDIISYYWDTNKGGPLVCSGINGSPIQLKPQNTFPKIDPHKSASFDVPLSAILNYIASSSINIEPKGLYFIRVKVDSQNTISGIDLPTQTFLFETYGGAGGVLIFDTVKEPFASALVDPENDQQLLPFADSRRYSLLVNWDVHILNLRCEGLKQNHF